jgi:hypothetical protein
MSKPKRGGTAVLSRAEIPANFVPMSGYQKRGETIYSVVKKAALHGRIESFCLFENGRFRSRPRRWLNPAEVDRYLAKRSAETESPLFAAGVSAAPAPQRPAPFQIDGAAALVEAVRMLTLEIHEAAAAVVEAIAAGRPEREPETFGET